MWIAQSGEELTIESFRRVRSSTQFSRFPVPEGVEEPELVLHAAISSGSARFKINSALWLASLRYYASACRILDTMYRQEIPDRWILRALEIREAAGQKLTTSEWESSIVTLLRNADYRLNSGPFDREARRSVYNSLWPALQKSGLIWDDAFLAKELQSRPFGDLFHELKIEQTRFTADLQEGKFALPPKIKTWFETATAESLPAGRSRDVLLSFSPYIEECTDRLDAVRMASAVAKNENDPNWVCVSVIARNLDDSHLGSYVTEWFNVLNWSDPRVLRMGLSQRTAGLVEEIKSLGRSAVRSWYQYLLRVADSTVLFSYLTGVARADIDHACDLLDMTPEEKIYSFRRSPTLNRLWAHRGFGEDLDRIDIKNVMQACQEDPGDSTLANYALSLSSQEFGSPGVFELHRRGLGSGRLSGGTAHLAPASLSLVRQWQGDYRRFPRPADTALARCFKDAIPNFCGYGEFGSIREYRSLFIIADQGVSDEVRAAQMIEEVASRSREVFLTCEPRLERLFRKSFGHLTHVKILPCERLMKGRPMANPRTVRGVALPVSRHLSEIEIEIARSCEAVILLDNLMYLRTAIQRQPPKRGAYLLSSGGREERSKRSLTIGLQWRSHLVTGPRARLYPTLAEIAPLLKESDDTFISFQHGLTVEERVYAEHLGVHFLDIDLFNDFDSLADCLLSCDLLVGSSSLPLELGAALGIPVLQLGFSPETVWLRANSFTQVRGGIIPDFLTQNSFVCAPYAFDPSATRAYNVGLAVNTVRDLVGVLSEEWSDISGSRGVKDIFAFIDGLSSV